MKRTKGFTLTEMVTVMAIIGMIATMAVPFYARSARQARENTLRANLATVRAALAAAFHDTGHFPSSLSDLALTTPSTTAGFTAAGAAGTMDANEWRGPYLTLVPVDPVSGTALTYTPAGGGGNPAGTVKPSATGNDLSGVAFSTY